MSDMAIHVVWQTAEKYKPHNTIHGVIIYHTGEFDGLITLADIKERYPKVELVIAEYGLHGKIYRYGNHGPVWEEVGKTEGYA